ncbi:MAG: glycoside hydrolase family 3 N-terminal domain-containing protein, partial [Prevotella sp.]|nr:glycoside hydrolase family 3 N-terminal domain-containing protein [Prevotella sp.]
MKKTFLCMAATCMLGTAFAQSGRPAIPVDQTIERNIDNWLSKMTLDEKVGQMLQLEINAFGNTEMVNGKPVFHLDEAKLDTILQKYKVGSILNAPGTRAQTVADYQTLIKTIQKRSMKFIGIPCIYGLDNNHGSTYVQGGTLFPQPINMAASFNTELVKNGAIIDAYETRAANTPWVFNPTIDLGRDPRWSRIWESYGEDALVNSRMVEAAISGYQGSDPNHLGKYNVATSVKHYFAYGAPFSGKDRTPAYVDPSMLREKYFEPF